MVQDTHARSTRKQQLLVVGTCSLCGKSCYEQQYDTAGCYRDDTNNAQHACITTCAHNKCDASATSADKHNANHVAQYCEMLSCQARGPVAARYSDNKLTPAATQHTEPAFRAQSNSNNF